MNPEKFSTAENPPRDISQEFLSNPDFFDFLDRLNKVPALSITID
jgi:hypothetical protein